VSDYTGGPNFVFASTDLALLRRLNDPAVAALTPDSPRSASYTPEIVRNVDLKRGALKGVAGVRALRFDNR
jgi:hypothetical protein